MQKLCKHFGLDFSKLQNLEAFRSSKCQNPKSSKVQKNQTLFKKNLGTKTRFSDENTVKLMPNMSKMA